MWGFPEGSVEDWKRTFANPDDPTYEELRALQIPAKPGKQCPHPVSSWFQDPRPNLLPPRSRKALLTEIFREHTLFDERTNAILEHYTSAAEDIDVNFAPPKVCYFISA